MRKFFSVLVGSMVLAALVVGILFAVGVVKIKPGLQNNSLTAGFKSIAELSVEEYYFKDVAQLDESAKPLGIELPFTNKKILLTYQGSVKAGVRNFEAVEVSIDEGSKKIVVKAPKVEVLDTKIDNSSVKVFDEKSNLFNSIKVEDTTNLLAGKQTEATDKAVEAGILDRAQHRAEEILKSNVKGVLSGAQQEEYSIEVEWVG